MRKICRFHIASQLKTWMPSCSYKAIVRTVLEYSVTFYGCLSHKKQKKIWKEQNLSDIFFSKINSFHPQFPQYIEYALKIECYSQLFGRAGRFFFSRFQITSILQHNLLIQKFLQLYSDNYLLCHLFCDSELVQVDLINEIRYGKCKRKKCNYGLSYQSRFFKKSFVAKLHKMVQVKFKCNLFAGYNGPPKFGQKKLFTQILQGKHYLQLKRPGEKGKYLTRFQLS